MAGENFLTYFLEHAYWLLPILALCMIICMEVGYRVGRASSLRHTGQEEKGSGAIEAAIFGLLGLMLAFTFSAAQSRVEKRRDLVVKEANAIGTAYLRLDLLAAEAQPALRKAFREYLDTRIAVYEAIPDFEKVYQGLARADQLQKKIWTMAQEAVRADSWNTAGMLLMPALNEMIDVTAERTMAAKSHTPSIIFILLLILALFSSAMAGYAMSKSGWRNAFHWVVFAAVISVTVYVIIDLEFPRLGMIRLDVADEVLIQLRDSIR